MNPSQFHALMSVLLLIAYYLSGRLGILGLASFLWACLYVLDVTLAIKILVQRSNDDGDNGSKQSD